MNLFGQATQLMAETTNVKVYLKRGLSPKVNHVHVDVFGMTVHYTVFNLEDMVESRIAHFDQELTLKWDFNT